MTKQDLLKSIPSVDEVLKSEAGKAWLQSYPRKTVLRAIRESFNQKRKAILDNRSDEITPEVLYAEIQEILKTINAYNLVPVINATGIIIHTNLGRSILSEASIRHLLSIAGGYSNLEYDVNQGKRGKRYSHIDGILKELTEAEDAFVVNNNAAAVLIALNTLSKNKEVVISRGELIEIGDSFRIPDVMTSSGALLREVGTTNKTRLSDYENAVHENTSLLLKIHTSNYRIRGFTESVSIEQLVEIGEKFRLPVMFDLGSGCLMNMGKYGIKGEPNVSDIVKAGVDIVTFSGDKLLGGPQVGILVGKRNYIQRIRKNPLARAVRIDKLTLAALEVTLICYRDEQIALQQIPTLRMLLQHPEEIQTRAERLAGAIKHEIDGRHISIAVNEDIAMAGGGSLPETYLPTSTVNLKCNSLSVDKFAKLLRYNKPPIISRIKDDMICLDARTIHDEEIETIGKALKTIDEMLP